MDVLASMHAGLVQRRSPQEVALDLRALGAEEWLSSEGARELRQLAAQGQWRGVSLVSTWRHHPGLARAYRAAEEAMLAVCTAAGRDVLFDADAQDARSLLAWVGEALEVLGVEGEASAAEGRRGQRTKTVTYPGWRGEEVSYTLPVKPAGARGERKGHADPRTRLDAAARREALPGVSVRAYRRAVASVCHLQQRAGVLLRERQREMATAFGKGRLASSISLEEFSASRKSAAFVAYYVARLGMRTLFTNDSQARPMDALAEELLAAALADPEGRPDVIARVLTRQSVLAHLSEEEKGVLLGVYFETLREISDLLLVTFDPARDRRSMTVRQGDDSSTWNAASRAFNQARTGWLSLTHSLGLGVLVEERCPGKVPALVASDVAAWHSFGGGGLHADTEVFAVLPLPWEVVLGMASCSAEEVREACRVAGVDPEEEGWTSPYSQKVLERVEAAPDLVHGVVVSSPALALMLRDAGAFSGQA